MIFFSAQTIQIIDLRSIFTANFGYNDTPYSDRAVIGPPYTKNLMDGVAIGHSDTFANPQQCHCNRSSLL